MGFILDYYGLRSKDFIEGMKEGIKLYAYWEDGNQYVGIRHKPLKEALKEIDEIKGYED